jgi:SAM-dependent methyltransferase
MSAFLHSTTQSNIAWFQDNARYAAKQTPLECYRHIQKIVEREIRGEGEVLDIGNGGFFNYDTALARRVTAVDLFLSDGPGPTANSSFRRGCFLDLPVASESFDCVLEQNVFHHVTGPSVAENHRNLGRCLGEMCRCLRPGGKAVIIESTVGPLFYWVEWLLYRPAAFLKRGGHPVTFQFTPRQIVRAAEAAGFGVEEFTFVPRGLLLLQMGYRWPSCLTPAKPIKLVLRKPGVSPHRPERHQPPHSALRRLQPNQQ